MFAPQSFYQRTNHQVAKLLRQGISSTTYLRPIQQVRRRRVYLREKDNRKIEGGTFGIICRIECMFSHGGCCLELRTDMTTKLGGIRETRESSDKELTDRRVVSRAPFILA